jgi:hypothetical protein
MVNHHRKVVRITLGRYHSVWQLGTQAIGSVGGVKPAAEGRRGEQSQQQQSAPPSQHNTRASSPSRWILQTYQPQRDVGSCPPWIIRVPGAGAGRKCGASMSMEDSPWSDCCWNEDKEGRHIRHVSNQTRTRHWPSSCCQSFNQEHDAKKRRAQKLLFFCQSGLGFPAVELRGPDIESSENEGYRIKNCGERD